MVKTKTSIFPNHHVSPICYPKVNQTYDGRKALWFFLRNNLDNINDRESVEDYPVVVNILPRHDPRCIAARRKFHLQKSVQNQENNLESIPNRVFKLGIVC